MRIFLFTTILATIVSLTYVTISNAACPEGPLNTFNCNTLDPNPDPDGIQRFGDPNNFIITVNDGAGIDTTLQPELDDDGIVLGNGNDMITVDGGSVIGQDGALDLLNGNNTITLRNATLRGITDPAIRAGNGQDILNIENSILNSFGSDIMSIGDGNDIVTVSDSELIVMTVSGGDNAINVSDGDDTVSTLRSILQGARTGAIKATAISLGAGNDTLTLGTGTDLRSLMDGGQIQNGRIDCNQDFDTLIFAMEVPEDDLFLISAQLAAKDPAGDSITINGLEYEWIACERIVNELVGVNVISPVPTLSEWGLISMAAILGIVGFIVARRKQAIE